MTRDRISADWRAASNARSAVRWARERLGGAWRGPQDVMDELQTTVEAIIDLERATVLYVAAARQRGESWDSIAAVLGVTRQAASQRYAAAVRRREALDDDWRRDLVGVGGVRFVERRGVWEGRLVELPPRTTDRKA